METEIATGTATAATADDPDRRITEGLVEEKAIGMHTPPVATTVIASGRTDTRDAIAEATANGTAIVAHHDEMPAATTTKGPTGVTVTRTMIDDVVAGTDETMEASQGTKAAAAHPLRSLVNPRQISQTWYRFLNAREG